jgi:hypothetical protein
MKALNNNANKIEIRGTKKAKKMIITKGRALRSGPVKLSESHDFTSMDAPTLTVTVDAQLAKNKTSIRRKKYCPR